MFYAMDTNKTKINGIKSYLTGYGRQTNRKLHRQSSYRQVLTSLSFMSEFEMTGPQ